MHRGGIQPASAVNPIVAYFQVQRSAPTVLRDADVGVIDYGQSTTIVLNVQRADVVLRQAPSHINHTQREVQHAQAQNVNEVGAGVNPKSGAVVAVGYIGGGYGNCNCTRGAGYDIGGLIAHAYGRRGLQWRLLLLRRSLPRAGVGRHGGIRSRNKVPDSVPESKPCIK